MRVILGYSALPDAPLAGGSMGTASWGSAVAAACAALLKDGEYGSADTTDDVAQDEGWARHSFGAQFAEVLVDPATGEVRVPRLLGVFAAGRVISPVLARSQFIGGMTMGLSMALFEETAVDPTAGAFVRTDLAQYHIATCADVPSVEAFWIDEDDPHLWPGGGKGIGEIGITGTAAAIGNAVWHATGRRVRDLPITPAKLLSEEPHSAPGERRGADGSKGMSLHDRFTQAGRDRARRRFRLRLARRGPGLPGLPRRGARGSVRVSARDQRRLAAMDRALATETPRLASMFAMFNELAGEEPVGAERLPARAWPRPGLAQVAFLATLAAIVALCVVLSTQVHSVMRPCLASPSTSASPKHAVCPRYRLRQSPASPAAWLAAPGPPGRPGGPRSRRCAA